MSEAQSLRNQGAAADVKRTEMLLSIASTLGDYAARYEGNEDPRCVFTFAYGRMTRVIAEELPTSDIADKDWVASLAVTFAGYYLRALDAYDQGRLEPGAWQTAFDAMCRRRTSVLEELLFGMTVHIVHDLPLALCDVGLATSAGEPRIRDFHVMNTMLGNAVDDIQEAVSRRYAPLLRWLDRLAEGYDEILTNYGLRMSRGLAWYNANRLLDPRSRAEARSSITRSSVVTISEVLDPPVWSVRLVFRGMRIVAALGRRWPAKRMPVP